MGEDVLDAPAPERFEIVEQAMGGPQRCDIALVAAERLDARCEECIVVEDAPAGV